MRPLYGSKRRYYYPIDLADFEVLMDESDERLFRTTRTILRMRSFHLSQQCRKTTSSRSVYMTGYFCNINIDKMIDKNFITRLLSEVKFR